MAKKTENVTQEVKQRIKEMTEKKQADLSAINEKREEARTRKEAAEARLREATELMNLDAYEEAKADISKAKTAIDMYSGRYEQLRQQEYISEEESDRVIDSLLAYEDQLQSNFLEDIKEPLKNLLDITNSYFDAVEDTERTIRTWEATIHANYSTRGRTGFFDKSTGRYTDRSKTPVPVRSSIYTGCKEAHQLKEYLSKAPL